MWNAGPEILTVAEMNDVDRLTASAGVRTLDLMENAGRQVANEIAKRYAPCKTTVLCGPGNNGGDGYVVARHLQARGFDVEITLIGERPVKDDAKHMASLWKGKTSVFDPKAPVRGNLVVDAVYGAGLSRGLTAEVAQLFEDISEADVPIVAVDVPSGIGGDQARFLDNPEPWSAALTVTFFRKKPAHVLYPARGYCGEIVVADIGIPSGILHALKEAGTTTINRPSACNENLAPPLPSPASPTTHKYKRGHCLVVSGPANATGAARLAAQAAMRSGAGLVTVVGDPATVPTLAATLTTIMVREATNAAALQKILSDKRMNSVVIGPGCGVGPATQEKVLAALMAPSVVLDADALTSFEGAPDALFAKMNTQHVLTPHEGEFERLFPGVLSSALNRINAAREAAQKSGAIVLLKGPDTVIAKPDGEAVVNTNAPPQLATAGSGDVLAGIIGGLLAQGMSAFDAARTGAFLHGECGNEAGIGLMAEDLPAHLPHVLKRLGKRRFDGL